MVRTLTRPREARPEDEEQISALVFHVGRELRTALDRRLLEHGLTSQQASLLLLSRLLGERKANKIAERLGTDTAGMTRLLDRLESKGLIFRKMNPDDRRSIVIALGPKSRHMLPRLIPEFRHVERGLLDGFSEEEIRELNSLLRRMLKNAHRMNE